MHGGEFRAKLTRAPPGPAQRIRSAGAIFLCLQTGISCQKSTIIRDFWNFRQFNLKNFGGGIMPKQKTHKGMKKRFKITASGKAKHRKAFRGHILGKKSPKRKRDLRQDGVIVGAEAKIILEALRPGS